MESAPYRISSAAMDQKQIASQQIRQEILTSALAIASGKQSKDGILITSADMRAAILRCMTEQESD